MDQGIPTNLSNRKTLDTASKAQASTKRKKLEKRTGPKEKKGRQNPPATGSKKRKVNRSQEEQFNSFGGFKNPLREKTADPAVRERFRAMITKALHSGCGDDLIEEGQNSNPGYKLAQELEHQIFQTFNNTEQKYMIKMRSRLFNLQINPELRQNFLLGKLSPETFAKMDFNEMASEDLRAWRAKQEQDSISKAETASKQNTRLLKCINCEVWIQNENEVCDQCQYYFLGGK